MTDPGLEIVLDNLDRAFATSSWHGTNLRGAIRGLTLEVAAFRPRPDRHNVWELVVHCAYWKYAARRQLTGEKRGSFPLAGSNFFPRPQGAAAVADWRRDVALLERCHEELRAVAARLAPGELRRSPRPSGRSRLEILLGVAAHDLYHAGQIQLLKRLARGRGR